MGRDARPRAGGDRLVARIRTVKPEFYSDPQLGQLTLEARYLYKATWNFADDEGRLPADPRILKSQVFPYDDHITTERVEQLLHELVSLGKAVRYEVENVPYLFLPNFRTHQRISKPQPAKYPPPPKERSRKGRGTVTPISDPIRRESLSPSSTDVASAEARAGVVGEFFDFLVEQGHDRADAKVVADRFAARTHFGAPITDPVAWAEPFLKNLKAARTSRSVEKRAVLDGVEHVWTDAGWEPVNEAVRA